MGATIANTQSREKHSLKNVDPFAGIKKKKKPCICHGQGCQVNSMDSSQDQMYKIYAGEKSPQTEERKILHTFCTDSIMM